ncbi:homoserine O-acetyltransferase [Skermanella stibiiresistens SB22]|uniref:Probable acyltransferase n=1 Tax=Skermanella stibiiresistens SB22 TaxID=1385369 RepID=W9H470_9PROT|nr:homoserine O-acetyltransferase [Skermanella stibiiresistens SB22]
MVRKRVFEMETHTTFLGGRIDQVRFGWESYGTLNAARDNAVLILHPLLLHGHAAGKYDIADKRVGFWDSIIGPGKVIDTDKYFVISADCLCNPYARSPEVVTTGPASIDPRTGAPYGPTFPLITFHDLVDVQMALLDSLGIGTLHAAMGLSMGGYNCLELATSYPDRIRKIIPIACAPASDAWLIAWTNAWSSLLSLDPNWRGGAYPPNEPPDRGMAAVMKLITMIGWDWNYTNDLARGEDSPAKPLGRAWADAARDPARSMDARYLIEANLEAGWERRVTRMDANNFNYLTRALRSYKVGRQRPVSESLEAIQAEVMLIHFAEADHMFSEGNTDRLIKRMLEAGVRLRILERSDSMGHSDMKAVETAQTAQAIKDFIET